MYSLFMEKKIKFWKSLLMNYFRATSAVSGVVSFFDWYNMRLSAIIFQNSTKLFNTQRICWGYKNIQSLFILDKIYEQNFVNVGKSICHKCMRIWKSIIYEVKKQQWFSGNVFSNSTNLTFMIITDKYIGKIMLWKNAHKYRSLQRFVQIIPDSTLILRTL